MHVWIWNMVLQCVLLCLLRLLLAGQFSQFKYFCTIATDNNESKWRMFFNFSCVVSKLVKNAMDSEDCSKDVNIKLLSNITRSQYCKTTNSLQSHHHQSELITGGTHSRQQWQKCCRSVYMNRRVLRQSQIFRIVGTLCQIISSQP